MENLTGIFKLIEEKKYEDSYCFLCGGFLDESNRTVEYIIPKWLQKEFNLWNLQLRLINETTIPYKSLTIPCCFTCNNKHLEPFEKKVKAAFKSGFDDFFKLDRYALFLWLGKIYYGLLYKEMFLPLDRRNPTKGNITNPEFLDSFYSHLLFLQGIREKHKFSNFFPASIYIFETQWNNEIEGNWDLVDNHDVPFIAIRMKNIGVIALLQDCQTTQKTDEDLEKYRTHKLHPIQFRELVAQIFYKGFLFNRTPKFINHQYGNNDKVEIILLPLGGIAGGSVFNDWNYDEYGALLAYYLDIPYGKIRRKENAIITFLTDKDGKPVFMDLNKN